MYFAEIENGVVKRVVASTQEFIDSGKLGDPKNWVETSVDGSIRKNYAGVGYNYDSIRDAFIPPRTFTSWILEEDSCLWKAPIPVPQDGKGYDWNEDLLNWVEVPKLEEENG